MEILKLFTPTQQVKENEKIFLSLEMQENVIQFKYKKN